jgi:hypothetical protein
MILATILSLTVLGQVVLPGNDLDVEKAQEKAHVIAVGKISQMGSIFGVGAASFGSFELEQSEVLKGMIEEKVMKQLGYVATGHEVSPKQGEEYVVFIERYKDHVTVIKMLPGTKENVTATKEAIKAKKP